MNLCEWLYQCDLILLLALNGSDSALLDGLFWAITKTATWLPLYAGLLWIVVKNHHWRHSLLIVAMVALLVLVADQVASGLCKAYFQRLRPTHDAFAGPLIDVVHGYRGGLYGFFSSHAANTFAVATFFARGIRTRRGAMLLYLWALLSSYSRLYLGVHYPSDILVGILFGCAAGFAFSRAYQTISARWLPAPLCGEPTQLWLVEASLGLSAAVVIVKAVCHALAA